MWSIRKEKNEKKAGLKIFCFSIPPREGVICAVASQATNNEKKYHQKEYHFAELYLQLEGIDHSKTQVRHPQGNGICERLHRTMQDEFYAIAFRKKLYKDLETLQTDLDEWIRYYNEQRPHSGRYCFGKTPLQTFNESLNLAKEKLLDQVAKTAWPIKSKSYKNRKEKS